MQKLRFQSMISKYSIKATLINSTDGGLVNGKWQEGTKEYLEFEGIISKLNPNEVEYYGGGKYTTQDIKIQVREGLEGTVQVLDSEDNLVYKEPKETKPVEFQEGLIVIFNDTKYKIDTDLSLENYSDFEAYIAKKQVVNND